jgi:hypothetical protein
MLWGQGRLGEAGRAHLRSGCILQDESVTRHNLNHTSRRLLRNLKQRGQAKYTGLSIDLTPRACRSSGAPSAVFDAPPQPLCTCIPSLTRGCAHVFQTRHQSTPPPTPAAPQPLQPLTPWSHLRGRVLLPQARATHLGLPLCLAHLLGVVAQTRRPIHHLGIPEGGGEGWTCTCGGWGGEGRVRRLEEGRWTSAFDKGPDVAFSNLEKEG